ncbi:type VII secretion system-associated protein [Lentzea sp. NPDC102401]|uniref:type VII secretion system-associated protein n=1 Tax=Lentzea sp. NPDC102401 TaxID=3364128 RepID=UPI0037F2F9D9
MTQPGNALGTPEITDKMRATAKQSPGVHLYAIDPMFDPDGAVPPFAIRGAFPVDERGEIGEFIPNAEYRPSPRALELSLPENALERAIELASTGYGPDADVVLALLEAEVFTVDREENPGHFAIAREGDDQVLHVFTSEARLPGNWSRWQRARGSDLGGLEGVLLRLNPGVPAVASVTIPAADLVAAAKPAAEPELGVGDFVVWNNRLLPTTHRKVDHRIATHAVFDDGSGTPEPLGQSLVESDFTHFALAHGTDGSLYKVRSVSDDDLEVALLKTGKPPEFVTRSRGEFERLAQMRFNLYPSLDVTDAAPPYLVIPGSDQKPAQADALVDEITALLTRHCPGGWQTIVVECHALGPWQELTASFRGADGHERHWFAPVMAGQWFQRLRAANYAYPFGAWTTAHYEVTRGERPKLKFSTRAEPRWAVYFDRGPMDLADQLLRTELLRFPRMPQATPEWMAAALSTLTLAGPPKSVFAESPARGNRETHLVRVFDGMDEAEKPVLFRSPVVPGEKKALLDYLTNATVVLASRGLVRDWMDPERAREVPMAFHTDGRWVWPSTVAYYLEKYDVAPDQSFLAHIRERGYQLPRRLTSPVRARALAVATDAPELEPALAAEFETAAQAVHGIAEFLALDKRSYSLGTAVENALCLVREEDTYVVFWLYDGDRRFYAEFDSPGDAATYLIGFMYSYTDALRQPSAAQ